LRKINSSRKTPTGAIYLKYSEASQAKKAMQVNISSTGLARSRDRYSAHVSQSGWSRHVTHIVVEGLLWMIPVGVDLSPSSTWRSL
jgi:uncharacterized protein YfiM (DUF2279 family)